MNINPLSGNPTKWVFIAELKRISNTLTYSAQELKKGNRQYCKQLRAFLPKFGYFYSCFIKLRKNCSMKSPQFYVRGFELKRNFMVNLRKKNGSTLKSYFENQKQIKMQYHTWECLKICCQKIYNE